jgi:phospholipase C
MQAIGRGCLVSFMMERRMMFLSRLQRMVVQRMKTAVRRRRPKCRPQSRFSVQLRLDRLEDRLTPSAGPLQNINHFVVIYQENQSFDGLYGNFPGANGIANASATSLNQVDRITGLPLRDEARINPYIRTPDSLQNPPPPLNGSTIDTRFLTDPSDPNSPTAVNTLRPYDLSGFIGPLDRTGDIVHRFWQEQFQIDGGNQDKYVTWSDNPGLVMSHFDATNMPEGLLAQQYSMDDNFFHAAFGGSFLNHQFLVAAAAPVYPNAPASLLPMLDANGQLVLDGAGKLVQDGNITPIGGVSFVDPSQTFDQNYAINTIFSTNLAPDFVGNNTSNTLLPPQNDSNPADPSRPYIPTIGDQLNAADVSWKWYSGGWDNALIGSPSNPVNGGHTPANDPADPLFQWHHQPLAYYDNFAPWLPNGQRNPRSAAHLQDETNFFNDLSNGNLPAVSFIKPLGPDNEHPGYANLLQGQQHVADIVHAIQNSPDWASTAIIVTYDENGGRWDHVSAPDTYGIWGTGTRVPTIVISPYAKHGFVDHIQHDTLSILRTIDDRFGLEPLNANVARATSLASNFQTNPQVSIGTAYVQPDADNLGRYTLIVQGTEGDDTIHISLDSGEIHVEITSNGVNFDHYFAESISRIEVYGQGGNDHITVDDAVTTPAFIFAGDGNDVLQAGGGASVLVGGNGNNELFGGAGPSILIGGSGHAGIHGGAGSSLLIAGTTKFDANAEALRALEAEWSQPLSSTYTFATKVAHIEGGATGGRNGGFILDATTVHSSGQGDELTRSTSDQVNDLVFAHLFGGGTRDSIDDLETGDSLYEI